MENGPILTTHEVTNQSPAFADIDLWATDIALREAVAREGGAGAEDGLDAFGRRMGSAAVQELGRLANAHPPALRAFDAKGYRLDTVEFHPAYHSLMRMGVEAGLHSAAWEEGAVAVHVARAARLYLTAQAECGHLCPLTMTHAAPAALAAEVDLLEEWRSRLLSRLYDPVLKEPQHKLGATLGMGMTEKQGGTDVRANTTRAEPAGEGLYRLTGHKWFMSAPMCDAFLVLAQTPGGLTAFLMPRVLPDGTVNALRFQRLKDKLGNRSNASAEVEFHGAFAHRVGEEGRGVATIMPMVTLTRLDCALASAGLMRLGLSAAVYHARHRRVFGTPLAAQPLMQGVLADLALDAEAALALTFRLARAFDGRAGDEREAAFARVMTPVVKYWVCKTAPGFLYEAMECLGGNGYVEEGPLARAYREAPVNAIWEGSGNVMALDLIRALGREPETLGLVLDEVRAAGGDDARIAAALEAARELIADEAVLEAEARSLAERLALLVAAALLRANAPDAVAEAFAATRLAGSWRSTYGQLPSAFAAREIMDRAFPG